MMSIVKKCKFCGCQTFHDISGKKFCTFCNCELQDYTEQLSDCFQTIFTPKVRVKQKREETETEPKREVLWTTTQAFNKILVKQIECISQIKGIGIALPELMTLTKDIWFTYLVNSKILENCDTNEEYVETAQHPSTRYRDQQIVKRKVTESLPKYKNIKHEFDLNETNVVMSESAQSSGNEMEFEYKEGNMFESEQQMENFISSFDLSQSYDQLMQSLSSERVIDSDLGEGTSAMNMSEETVETQPYNELEAEQTQQLSEDKCSEPDVKRTQSKNISTKGFTTFMRLPKTLAIINIVCRLYKTCNIQVSDLIRFSIEENIPYFNCFDCFPKDWIIRSNDCPTFTSSTYPSGKTINQNSAQIAKLINIKSFPVFDFNPLLERYLKDLNLPKDIKGIIDKYYNISDNFGNKVTITTGKRVLFPHFDRWALMAIVMVLKRIFVLDDNTENHLSTSAESGPNSQNIFIWQKWEQFSRLRLNAIKTNYLPLFGQSMENIRNTELFSAYYSKRTQCEREVEVEVKPKYNERQIRENIENEFKKCSQSTENRNLVKMQSIGSMFVLTKATEFALNFIECESDRNELKVNFNDKTIIPYVCPEGKPFHRPYKPLAIGNAVNPKNLEKWSKCLSLLIELSLIILNCNKEDLYVILNQMEKTYFLE